MKVAIGEDAEPNPRVFVVHGRNEAARDSMFAFLRALGLSPLEWDQAVALTGKGSPYVGEVLETAFTHGRAVIVLMTPDDVAHLNLRYADGDHDPEVEARGQARPNVLFEAGMAIGRNEDHTILVELGDLRPFSDIGGRHTLRLNNSAAKRQSLASRLETAGLPVDRSGTDWLTVGDFTPPGALPLGKRAPAPERRGPNVDARWLRSGGNKLDRVTILNGPVDLYNVKVAIPESVGGVRLMDNDQPVQRLPAHKSFTIRGMTDARFLGGMSSPQQFDLLVQATLADGSPFKQLVWVDSAGS